MNLVMTGDGRIIEVQGTAEKKPFTQASSEMMALIEGHRAAGRPAKMAVEFRSFPPAVHG
jgi:ribonuclease PH